MSSTAAPPPGRPRRVADRLVGREPELADLVRAVSAPPGVVVVEGEAGIGKSRLVAELPAHAPGRRYLTGGCELVQEPFPLAAVLEAVYGGAAALPERSRLSPVTGALVPLLPELADRLPPAPPPLEDQLAERHRLFRAVATLLGELGPAVLVLEDVHWADAGTADFLAYLTARMPAGLAVVLTLRSGAASVWESVARSAPVHLTLRPLPPEDVAALAANLLGTAEVPARFAGSLHELTAGIPFVVEEVVAGVLARDTPARFAAAGPGPQRYDDALDAADVPPALRDVVRPRLDALDEQTREILDAAAVYGLDPDERVLAAVVDRDVGTVVRALGRALTAGLLHSDDSSGQIRFRHALARQVVYQALPAPSRRWLHQRVAEVLEAGPEPRPVGQLAHHFRLAGRRDDFVRYAEAAAERARALGDDAAAARFLIQAVESPGLPPQVRVRLAGTLARAAVHGLTQSEAAPVLDRVLADTDVPPGDRGELRFMLGRLLRQQGEALRGYEEIERSTADLAGRPDQLARALAILAVPDIVTGRPVAEHEARCAEAERVAARAADPAVDVAVGIAAVSLRIELADPSAGDLMTDLLARPALAGVPREHARACLNWAQGALHVGDVALAERMLAEGRAVAAATEYLRVSSILDLVSASVDRTAGRLTGLERRARQLVREPSDFTAANLDAEYLLGAVLATTGDQAEAEQRLRTVLATAEDCGALWPLVPARASLSRLLLAGDRAAEAAAVASDGLAVLRVKGNGIWAAETVLCLVEAHEALGDAQAAAGVVSELADGIGCREAPAARAYLAHCRAILAGSGDQLLSRAQEDFLKLGLRYEAARAGERFGLSWWQRHREAKHVQDALRSYDALGAERDVARLLRVMRRSGVPVPYPWRGGRRSYGARLSPREYEVARLAAAGRTNQQIAEQLYVSRRTVESHVASTLRKLGGHSRKDLATLLPPEADA